MHAYLGFGDYAVWFTVIVLQVALVPVLFQSGHHRQWPAFTGFASFCLVRSVTLLSVSASVTSYFYVYWVGQFLEVTLALLVMRELFARVMRPFGWIPPKVMPTLIGAGVLIFSAALALALTLPMTDKYPEMAFLMSFERVAGLILLAGFAGMVVFSSMTGSPWPRTAYGIQSGFLFYLSMHAIAETVAHNVANPRPIQMVGRMAFAVALVIWAAHLWKPEPASAKLPENIMDINRLRDRLQEQAEPRRRRS